MIRLSIKGQAVEVSEYDFVTCVAGSYYTLTEAYHRYHVSGFADWNNAFPKTLDVAGWETPIETLETQIDDEELREAFHSLREQVQELIRVDEQIIKWLAGFVGLSSLQDERDRYRLDRRLHKIVAEGPNGRPQGPIWAMQPEYRVLVGKSERVMLAVSETKQRIEQRLQQLLRHSDEGGDSFSRSKSSL